MNQFKLACDCGKVKGQIDNATARSGSRVVCCCSDCQAFAEHLKENNPLLDEFGGTDVYQTSQSQLTITSGQEYLRCIRLTPKGATRWYTDCCQTAIGNTLRANMPFVGVISSFWDKSENADQSLGPVRAYVQTQYARGEPSYPHIAKKYIAKQFPIGIILRIMRKILIWKVRGMHTPSAFYQDNRPVSKPNILGQ